MEPSLTKREPVALLGALAALVPAILALVVAFGVDLSDEQTAALLGVVAAITAAVTGAQRASVYPAGKVNEVMAAESVIGAAERR